MRFSVTAKAAAQKSQNPNPNPIPTPKNYPESTMGSDDQGESRRKERRSSPSSGEEAERTSKRRKHRHHRHTHRSRRHGEDTKHRGRDVDSPALASAPISMAGDELEEGEILEEEIDVEIDSQNQVCPIDSSLAQFG